MMVSYGVVVVVGAAVVGVDVAGALVGGAVVGGVVVAVGGGAMGAVGETVVPPPTGGGPGCVG